MSTPTPDVVERAKAALEGATDGPWFFIPGDDEEASVISEGEQLPDPITVGGITFNPGYSVAVDLRNGDAEFIAASRNLIPELIAELEKLRRAAKTLGKIIDDSLTDVLKATDSNDLIGENGDGDWMLVFERLAELRPARDAALAELEALRTAGPWMEHVERQRAMKRERDGECICNTGPDTDGPDEVCPWHGREYRYWVDGCTSLAAELEKHRAFVAAVAANSERDICPACSYLFRECVCGVGLEELP